MKFKPKWERVAWDIDGLFYGAQSKPTINVSGKGLVTYGIFLITQRKMITPGGCTGDCKLKLHLMMNIGGSRGVVYKDGAAPWPASLGRSAQDASTLGLIGRRISKRCTACACARQISSDSRS